MALDVYFRENIASILRSLDTANERHRTEENQLEIDAYQNALIDIGLAFGIMPVQKYALTKIDMLD